MAKHGVYVFDASFSSGVTRTLVQVAVEALHPVELTEWAVSFNSTSLIIAPIEIELLVQSADGTATTTAPFTDMDRQRGATFDTDGFSGFTAEPSAVVQRLWQIQAPAWSGVIYPAPRRKYVAKASQRTGLRILTPSFSGTAVGYIKIRE